MAEWNRIAVCSTLEHITRFWHVGINNDGTLLFIASMNDDYLVWNIFQQQTVSRGRRDAYADWLPLDDWLVDGYVEFSFPTLMDRFRVFGPIHDHALRIYARQYVCFDDLTHEFSIGEHLLDRRTLPYEGFPGDWAHASFSDDGSVIAVATPLDITLFGRCGT